MESKAKLWEILVPTLRNNGKPIRKRFHKVWDANVRKITGGLTIMPPTTDGEWISPDGVLFRERMIPVRICCTEEEIEDIADMTAKYYEQKAVMYYIISNYVVIKNYVK